MISAFLAQRLHRNSIFVGFIIKALLLTGLFASLLAPCALCQTVYDHFTGTQVNEKLWWQFGQRSHASVSNSLLE